MATILASTPDDVEATSPAPVRWQESLRTAIRSSDELLRLIGLPKSIASETAAADFPVFVPREFVAKMSFGNPQDPLLRQVLADPDEVADEWARSAFQDPVGDTAATRSPGLLQKYSGRALLITSGVCAIHCRYCFRRHFPYETAPKGPSGWQAALDAIQNDSSIEEVLLSGGDPLTVADSQLQWLMDQLNQIEHLNRIRIHSRVPVVIPQRVCPDLLDWVRSSRAAVYFVVHVNHPQEIDSSFADAMKKLRLSGASLLNQSVLLRGLNDAPDVQLELCRKLINLQIIPYYIHHLDRVSGAMHFESSIEIGHAIIQHLRENLPGYAVPRFVRELAGEPSKTPL